MQTEQNSTVTECVFNDEYDEGLVSMWVDKLKTVQPQQVDIDLKDINETIDNAESDRHYRQTKFNIAKALAEGWIDVINDESNVTKALCKQVSAYDRVSVSYHFDAKQNDVVAFLKLRAYVLKAENKSDPQSVFLHPTNAIKGTTKTQLKDFFRSGYVEFKFQSSLNQKQRESRDYLGPVYLRFYPSFRTGGKFWASNDTIAAGLRTFGNAALFTSLMSKIAFNRDAITERYPYENYPYDAWCILAGLIPSNQVTEFQFFTSQ